MFFVRCLKGPTDAFNIYDHVTFCTSSIYPFFHSSQVADTLSRTNSARHFYFNRIPRLWNTLPTIDLDQSTTSIKRKVRQFLWDYFMRAFKSDNPCLFHLLCPCFKCSCSSVTSSSLQAISFSYWTFSRMGVLDTLLEVC